MGLSAVTVLSPVQLGLPITTMNRAVLPTVLAVVVLGYCAQAVASARGTASTNAHVVERVGIDVVSPLVLPSIRATTVGAGGRGTASGAPGSNATLTIRGQFGGAVSMSVPESFTVVRTGGTESLTVKTSTNSEFGIGDDGVMLGGTAMNGDTMSVNVGGALALASADPLVPGPYEGLLVVVVQYN
jgi:hypothetical protein